jgi:inosine/xanthosine triphosphatase
MNARELAEDERIGGRLSDWNHEPSERIPDGHEGAREAAIGAELDAARPDAPAEHAVDLREHIEAHLLLRRASLGEVAQRRADLARIDQCGGSTGELLVRSTSDARGALGVEGTSRLEPPQQIVEVREHLHARAAPHVFGVDEVEPQPLAEKDEGRAGARRWRYGEGQEGHRAQGYPAYSDAASSQALPACGVQPYIAFRTTDLARPRSPVTSVDPFRLSTFRRIAVGSTNPVKFCAVHAVLALLVPAAEIVAIQVPSGVPDQPRGDDETIRGARARARAAREALDADLGVGIEGGIVEDATGMRTCAWAAVVGRDGRVAVGGSLAMPLPPAVARAVREGAELGEAMDRVSGRRDTKRGAGAVGILTAGLVDRQRAYEILVTYALAPFLSPEYWASP